VYSLIFGEEAFFGVPTTGASSQFVLAKDAIVKTQFWRRNLI